MKKQHKKRELSSKHQRDSLDNTRTLQSFLSCLFYLAKEAEREGLPYISTVLKESIGKIDLLSRSGRYHSTIPNVIDDSLYEAMNFLHHLAELAPADRAEFMKVFDEIRRNFLFPVCKEHTGNEVRIALLQ